MRDVNRFDSLAGMDHMNNGKYVLFSDYSALQQEIKKLREALEWMSKYRNTTLFIEEPEQVADFFKKCDEALNSSTHARGDKT